jgi:tubulin polyglutamylase TTLL5
VQDIGDVCYGQSVIIQRYLANPLLLDGYKFDLRVYVLVTSFQPLEAFVYQEGFIRVCTHKYSNEPADLRNLFIHLTNSSIQKMATNGLTATQESISRHHADLDEAGGTKLTLTYLWRRLAAHGVDVDKLKADVDTVILKSLIAAQTDIGQQPNSFELFGYDVFIDDKLRPWLIEINSSPSMAQENLLDSKVKTKLIADTIRLVDPREYDREALADVLAQRLADANKKTPRFAQMHMSERRRIDMELTAILGGRKPRPQGHMPAEMGLYKRIAPGPQADAVYSLIRNDKNQKTQHKHNHLKNIMTSSAKRGKTNTTSGNLTALHYLAKGCNMTL